MKKIPALIALMLLAAALSGCRDDKAAVGAGGASDGPAVTSPQASGSQAPTDGSPDASTDPATASGQPDASPVTTDPAPTSELQGEGDQAVKDLNDALNDLDKAIDEANKMIDELDKLD